MGSYVIMQRSATTRHAVGSEVFTHTKDELISAPAASILSILFFNVSRKSPNF